MTDTRQFHLGTILSITTGRLVSPGGVGDIYDICDYMLGESHMTHQLPRASRVIEPQLREDFPDIAKIETPAWPNPTEAGIMAWLESLYSEHGEWHEIERFRGDYEGVDPLMELAEMMNKRGI